MPRYKLYIKLSDELDFPNEEEAREAAKEWADETAREALAVVEECYAAEVQV